MISGGMTPRPASALLAGGPVRSRPVVHTRQSAWTGDLVRRHLSSGRRGSASAVYRDAGAARTPDQAGARPDRNPRHRERRAADGQL